MAKSADYGLGEFTFPRGWFMVAEAAKVTSTPLSVRFFGQDFVLYRGASGTVYMIDAYCPHMGTHLGKNGTSFIVIEGRQVEGECIRCPYHAWKFGPDGHCVEIPYSDFIPPRAQIATYAVVERYGCIFHWHDPEGGAPDYDLPAIAEWDDPTWVRWRLDDLGEIAMHPIEVVDNICDIQHLPPIHASTALYFECELRGHKAWQRMGTAAWGIYGDDSPPVDFNTFYTGPGLLLSRYSGERASYMYVAHTPVDDGSLRIWHGAMMQIADRLPTAQDLAEAATYQDISRGGIAQDFDIWSNKRPCFQPIQMPKDGRFDKVRLWYKQFYNPRAKRGDFLRRSEGVYPIPTLPSGPENEDARAAVMLAG